MIADLAAANPKNTLLPNAVSITKAGYQRKAWPDLLRLIRTAGGVKDLSAGGRSLLKSILETLEIDVLRLRAERLAASEQRESLMKEIFHGRWETSGRPRVLLRFGRNHLHRGYDRRGVSTLGNFAAEVTLAHRLKAFNLAVFGGGGKIRLAEGMIESDERADVRSHSLGRASRSHGLRPETDPASPASDSRKQALCDRVEPNVLGRLLRRNPVLPCSNAN